MRGIVNEKEGEQDLPSVALLLVRPKPGAQGLPCGYRNSGTGASSAVPRCTGAGIGAQARQAAALPPVSQWAHPEEFLYVGKINGSLGFKIKSLFIIAVNIKISFLSLEVQFINRIMRLLN